MSSESKRPDLDTLMKLANFKIKKAWKVHKDLVNIRYERPEDDITLLISMPESIFKREYGGSNKVNKK